MEIIGLEGFLLHSVYIYMHDHFNNGTGRPYDLHELIWCPRV